MKLIRFGAPGQEQPGVLLNDGRRVDASAFGADYDEAFFGGDGIARLAQWMKGDGPGHKRFSTYIQNFTVVSHGWTSITDIQARFAPPPASSCLSTLDLPTTLNHRVCQAGRRYQHGDLASIAPPRQMGPVLRSQVIPSA